MKIAKKKQKSETKTKTGSAWEPRGAQEANPCHGDDVTDRECERERAT